MNHTGTEAVIFPDLHSLIQTKEDRIKKLKLRLRDEMTLDEEMEMLRNLSREMRDLHSLREKSYSSPQSEKIENERGNS